MFSKYPQVALVAAVLLAAACGANDDTSGGPDSGEEADVSLSQTSPPADEESEDLSGGAEEDQSAGNGGDNGDDASGDSSGDQVVISGLGDVSSDCFEALATFLQRIEPFAEGIDWSGADFAPEGSDGFFVALEEASQEFSADATACDDVDVIQIEGAEIELMLQVARDAAPGVVPWLEFLQAIEASQE